MRIALRPTRGDRLARGRWRPPSPVVDVSTRHIRPHVRLQLWVQAGGRCQFDGCNDYLLEHHVTLASGNFAEAAHIVAFRLDGPRGQTGPRPKDINALANLMLMCARCHKLVDDHPVDFTRETLREYKRAQEERIKYVTSLGPDRKTAVLVLKAPINGHTVAIPFDQVVEATSPRYPSRREPETIDLTTIADSGPAFQDAARDTIRETVDRFFGHGGEARKAGHVSLFALAPIPLLVFLGRYLTNKVPSDLYQRHRDTERWTWKSGGGRARYAVRQLQRGKRRDGVALVLSLSGTIRIRDLPQAIPRRANVYGITLAGQTPRPTFLRTRQDLEGFRIAYQEALGLIVRQHGLSHPIELFPAVPAPVAVLCGRELLPKVHPAVRVWDYDKAKGGFTYQLEVNGTP